MPVSTRVWAAAPLGGNDGVIEKGLRTGPRLDRRYGGTPATRVRGHDSERRDKPMIAMTIALVPSRGADHI